MASRTLNKLSDVGIKSAKLKAGRHSDGGGLYLNVAPTGSKSWLFMWTRDGKRREMGLGAYPAMPLSKARAKAADCRSAVEDGRDPIAEKRKEAEPTFGEAADKLIESMEGSWRNEKHRYQWKTTLKNCGDAIRKKRVSEVNTDDVLKVLKPLWQARPETASRLRGRIERVLEFAKAKGWREGENPALWRGHLRNILPPRNRLTEGHLAAMPYPDVPAFLVRVRASEAMAARALEFTILTAARSGETRGATWAELDLEKGIWTVPGGRMKAGKEHRVPLPKRAVEVLRELHEAKTGDLVFPGQKKGKPLSMMAMNMLMRRLKEDDFTVHGFRSAFRDWCGDATTFSREIAEAALAHRVGDAVEQAYRRADALEKRRKLMQAWADFCSTVRKENVVHLKRGPA